MIIQFIVHQAVVVVVCLPPLPRIRGQLQIQIRESEELPMNPPDFLA
jgi:hypothetical protein